MLHIERHDLDQNVSIIPGPIPQHVNSDEGEFNFGPLYPHEVGDDPEIQGQEDSGGASEARPTGSFGALCTRA
jgi:hypothetical protein